MTDLIVRINVLYIFSLGSYKSFPRSLVDDSKLSTCMYFYEHKELHTQFRSVNVIIVDSSNTDLNSAWMSMGLRLVFDESTIVYV